MHLRFLGLVLAIVAACAPASRSTSRLADRISPAARTPVPGAPTGVTAFVDVNVVPMDTERVIPRQTVLIKDGWVVALGPTTDVMIPASATRVDGRNQYLMPGLADMHTHLQVNDSAEAERMLFLWLANGVTTIRNADYFPALALPFLREVWHRGNDVSLLDGGALLRLRARASMGALWSPRIYTSGPWAGDSSGTLANVAPRLDAYKAAGYDFIKIHDETPQMVDAVAAAARRVGIPLMGHVVQHDSLERAFQLGYASIEHLTGYLEALFHNRVPSLQVGGADAAFLVTLRQQLDTTRIAALVAATQRAGVWNCPTQLLAENVAVETTAAMLAQLPETRYVPAQIRAGWEAWAKNKTPTTGGNVVISEAGGTLGARRQLIKALQEAGAGLLVGTDAPAPYITPGFGVPRELQALVRAGLTPYQALVAGTRAPAAFLGTLDETGTIAVGKRADLVLLRGNPLADVGNVVRPAGVMIGGRWLSRDMLDTLLTKLD